MNTAWLKTRQTKFGAYATLYILIIIGVLVMANWLANRHNKSVDTTANKRFSLSDQTKKIVGDLKLDAKITYFDKTDSFQRAKDLLDRYDTLSPKVSVDYIDPDKKPQVAKVAGVRNYGSIFVNVGTRREEAKSLTEEEITGAIIRTLKGGDRTVCSVSGSGEHTFEDTGRSGYSALKESIERNNYKTRTISLLEKPEVPKDCTVLLVAGPRFDYVQPVVDAIKKYVESGGRALIMLDAPVRMAKDTVGENALLTGVLAGWGITMNKDLVLDVSGIGQIFGFNEVVPLVASYENHAIVREMKGAATAFPLARSITTGTGDKVTVEKLFSTSENSAATSKLDIAGGELSLDPKNDKKGPLTLGAAGTYSTGQGNAQGRFVAVGSSGFAANNLLGFNGNRDLVLNMINWLSSDEDLISIRPKDPEDRRLSLNRAQMNVILYSSVILMPLMVILAGVSVWWKRR
jgi:ABC-type uncharacterized transport system involved in gliding motility auxiliary subunit